jgi:hypothetical protein
MPRTVRFGDRELLQASQGGTGGGEPRTLHHILSTRRGALSQRRTESTSVTREINPAEYEAENHGRTRDNYRQHSHPASAEGDDRQGRVERKDHPPDCRKAEMNPMK